MLHDRHVAFYARVSSERQTRENTIASQVAALRERIAADGGQLEPDDAYIDDGYSGSLLIRPALELRWSPWLGQFGGLAKLGSDCCQAANVSVPVAQYASLGVRPASVECGPRGL